MCKAINSLYTVHSIILQQSLSSTIQSLLEIVDYKVQLINQHKILEPSTTNENFYDLVVIEIFDFFYQIVTDANKISISKFTFFLPQIIPFLILCMRYSTEQLSQEREDSLMYESGEKDITFSSNIKSR